MANTDQNITELPIKTASEVLDADYMLGIDLVEGYQVSTKDFADYAVNRAAISIGGKTQTTSSAISEVRTTAGNAQPKESGKGLSANDFTNAYKSKLDGIASGAEVNVQSDWNASSGDAAILHKPTTISGYGITDAYTKAQMDTSLAAKSDKSTTYTKTEVDGFFDEKGLVDIEEGTDSEPYLFKVSPYGDRLYEKIIGGSVAWNQKSHYMNSDNWSTESGVTAEYSNGVAVVSSTTVGSRGIYDRVYISTINGHKYFVGYEAKGTSGLTARFLVESTQVSLPHTLSSDNWETSEAVLSNTTGGSHRLYLIGTTTYSGLMFKNVQLFDLTQMFGTEIADYIYSLEQSTTGEGVAFFRRLFPKSYYPYDAGSIQSVSGLMSHDTVGFNQWDEEWEVGGINVSNGTETGSGDRIRSKHYIHVLPNTVYCITAPVGGGAVCFYDVNKNFISAVDSLVFTNNATFTSPENGAYIRFMTYSSYGNVYNHDICINISDASKNGTYEPYVKHSYPLDSSLTLRGIPKLVDNKLAYDGDVYNPDGKVTRRYGIVDLGTLDWNYGASPNERFVSTSVTGIKPSTSQSSVANIICQKYKSASFSNVYYHSDDKIIAIATNGGIQIYDSTYTDATTFKTAMSGVTLVYELATTTAESAHPFQSPQRVTDGGTEEYVTTGIVPVGHESTYVINKAERFDAMPDVAPLDGDYIVRQRSGAMNLVDVEDYASFVESETGNPVIIETDAAQYAKNTHLTLAPVQDLHGYDHPWAGGAGKNLLPMTVARLKAQNTVGTWTGNAYAIDGVTFTVNTDSDGNITSISANGAPSNNYSQIYFVGKDGVYESSNLSSGTYIVSVDYGFLFVVKSNGNIVCNTGSSATITIDSSETYRIFLRITTNLSNEKAHPMIRLASVSDASFAPYSNVCPITGVDEVDIGVANSANLLPKIDKKLTSGNLTVTPISDGIVRVVHSGAAWDTVSLGSVVLREGNARLTLHHATNTGNISLAMRLKADQSVYIQSRWNENANVTIPTSGIYNVTLAVTGSRDEVINLGIFYDTTINYDTWTAPKESSILSLDLPEPVYSGTLDLETGEVVADMGIVDLGTLTWGASNNIFYSTGIDSLRANGASNIICEAYPTSTKTSWSAVEDMHCVGNIANGNIYIKDTNYSSSADFKTAMNGIHMCYELATPITYQLTPQQLALFKGINNVSTNAKTVQVTYRNGEFATTGDIVASTEVAKQNAIGESASYTDARLATELAPILGDLATAETSPASASHAVGEYLLYNNRLYKVLAAISAGQQLTIGTNVGQTNVAAELASQASAISALNSNTPKIHCVAWGTSVTFTCDYPKNIVIVETTHLFIGTVWETSVSVNLVQAAGSITASATKSGNSITITLSRDTCFSVVVF